jgi:hypothetical protein
VLVFSISWAESVDKVLGGWYFGGNIGIAASFRDFASFYRRTAGPGATVFF